MTRLKKIGGTISLVLAVVTASITIVILFTPLYEFTVWYHDLPERLNMAHETITENYYVLLRYLNVPWIQELNMPDFPSSEIGLFHMWEVKTLFQFNYGALLVSLIASFFYLRFLKRKELLYQLKKDFMLASLVPPLLIVFLAINFDRMFVLFHKIFFNNDAWLFNPATDPIILALPQEFFMYSFLLFFILVEIGFFLLYRYGRKKN
jgi:integral membrane protein (TIGR01906 family)